VFIVMLSQETRGKIVHGVVDLRDVSRLKRGMANILSSPASISSRLSRNPNRVHTLMDFVSVLSVDS
jgi:hypothetical protein